MFLEHLASDHHPLDLNCTADDFELLRVTQQFGHVVIVLVKSICSMNLNRFRGTVEGDVTSCEKYSRLLVT